MPFQSLFKKPVNATAVACVFFAVFIVAALLTRRCLYADGSYYLLKVLEAGNFSEVISCRDFATWLFQWPLVLAIKLGTTNLHWLSFALGIGCLSVWPLAMFLCYRMAPQHFWLVMLACAAGYLNAAFMAVGEHIVAHAFFWPALFAILFVRPLTPFAAASLLASSIILMRSYESMLFLGPLMMALLIWRMISGQEGFWRLAVLGAAVGFLALATYIAWVGVKYPNMVNYNGFKNGFIHESLYPPWTLEMSYFWVALMMTATLYPRVSEFLKRPAGLILMILVVLVWGTYPFLVPARFNPASQYESRFLDLVVPLALLPVGVVLAVRPKWLAGQIPVLIRLSAIMLVAQSLWHLSATCRWEAHVRDWKNLLATQRGPIYLPADRGFNDAELTWINPTLSLVIGPSRVQAMIMPDHTESWQPFDPFDPKSLPDFGRYGLDYTEYVNELKSQRLIHE